MTDVKPIRNVRDYEAALHRISELMGAEYGSPEGLELDILADYVVEYEGEREPMTHYRSREKGVGIDAEELAERYPRLFHMAAAGSWPLIERHGLCSTSALLDLFDVSGERRIELEARHRPEPVEICRRGIGRAMVRDRKSMNDGKLRGCLRDCLKPRDWYRILNSKVFFWPTRARLEGMLNANAYKNRRHTVLIVDTESLIAAHPERVTLSPIDSGSTLFEPAPRGRDTFLPLDLYPFDRRRRQRGPRNAVAELAVEYSVPDIREYVISVEERGAGRPLESIWRRASTGASPCTSRS